MSQDPDYSDLLVFVSPDETLRLLVSRDGDDLTIGFEDQEWHTHGDLLLGEYETKSQQVAVGHFIQDVITGKRPVVVYRKADKVVDVAIDHSLDSSLYRDPREDPHLEPDESVEVRRWSS